MIPLGLAVIMLGMGLTLMPEDFKSVLVHEPRYVVLGVILQYTVMPFLGWALGYVFNLPLPYALGLVLAGMSAPLICVLLKTICGLNDCGVLQVFVIPTVTEAEDHH